MKTIKLLFVIIPFCAFSQNQIKLKSGENIDGTVKSLSNGILTVAIKNNNLTFKQSDVEAIYFDKAQQHEQTKSASLNQKAKLKGVITYFFNKNYGDKPDVGAKIYLKKTDTLDKKRSAIYNYQRANVCRSLIKMNTNVESCKKTLAEIGANTDKEFEELNSKVIKEFMEMDYDESVKKVTADGNGNYSVSIAPGLYEVIFVSKGRNDLTLAEINGKISSNIIEVIAGDEITKDKRFDIY